MDADEISVIYMYNFPHSEIKLTKTNDTAAVALDGGKREKLAAYDPDRLLDALISMLKLKNDAALARALEVGAPVISKLRHHRLPVGASLLIRMHEVSDLTIGELRTLLGSVKN